MPDQVITLPEDIRSWLDTVPELTADDIEALRTAGEGVSDPDSLEVKDWELYYAETDCGKACTPNGCFGHTSTIPEFLVIGCTTLKFSDDMDEWQAQQAIAVSNFLSRMIEEAKERRRIAEAVLASNDVRPGTADPSIKFAVRTREELLRCIEKGYRLFFDHQHGVQFLRCPGLTDINYEL